MLTVARTRLGVKLMGRLRPDFNEVDMVAS